ncbi:MAG: YegS/Rv2252/BmrU family lipid kinase [Chitinophagales bacterium]
MERKKILFIINPISGVYGKEGIPEKIARYLDYVQYDFTIRYTQYAGHATEIAREAVEEGFQVVVAVGGDGSINEVARGLMNTNVALGLIPYGSGNGMAGHLKIAARNAKAAIEILNTGKTVAIDAIQTSAGPFFSVGGFGFDAHAARRFRSQEIRGFFSYFLATIREILYHYKPSEATITIDGREITREVYLFTAFNSSQYGYKFGVFPSTSMHDGVMDVIVLRSFPLKKLLSVVFKLAMKRPDLIEEAESFRGRHIRIAGVQKRVFQFDGDHFIFHDDLEMTVAPEALQVIVPAELHAY